MMIVVQTQKYIPAAVSATVYHKISIITLLVKLSFSIFLYSLIDRLKLNQLQQCVLKEMMSRHVLRLVTVCNVSCLSLRNDTVGRTSCGIIGIIVFHNYVNTCTIFKYYILIKHPINIVP